MFSSIFKEITDYLDRRFILALFFPCLFFWSALLTVYLYVNKPDILNYWQGLDTEIKVILIAAALIWVTFFSFVLANQIPWITSLYEGRWDRLPFGSFLAHLRRSYYVKVLKYLDESSESGYEQIYISYPLPTSPEQLMPTRLGNIIRNAELYPYERYEIDASPIIMWPRLYSILPESFIKILTDSKTSLDFMLVISFLSGIFALFSGLYLLVIRGPALLFLVCVLGGVGITWAAYKSSLNAAVSYTQYVKSAFDIYKADLIEKLGYKRPESLKDEIEFWDNLNKLIYRNLPENTVKLRYHNAKEEKKEPTSESEREESS